jgi:hypothetical protein
VDNNERGLAIRRIQELNELASELSRANIQLNLANTAYACILQSVMALTPISEILESVVADLAAEARAEGAEDRALALEAAGAASGVQVGAVEHSGTAAG